MNVWNISVNKHSLLHASDVRFVFSLTYFIMAAECLNCNINESEVAHAELELSGSKWPNGTMFR